MVKFKDDPSLGQVVANRQMFASIGVEPITKVSQISFAAGARKFSCLCGFVFTTVDPKTQYKTFIIAFVSKIRSKIYRQATRNPSQWFIMRRINAMRMDVLDKKALLINYGFDIDKFFDSDLFAAAVPKWEAAVKKGIRDAQQFMATLKDSNEIKEVERCIKAMTEAIPFIKVHRCNDQYFKLQELDFRVEDDKETTNEADASRFACKVIKTKEDGKDAWAVETVSGMWVATFFEEKIAQQFAEEYPAMKQKYIDDMQKFAAQFEEENPIAKTEEVDEEQLDAEIEEAVSKIYDSEATRKEDNKKAE